MNGPRLGIVGPLYSELLSDRTPVTNYANDLEIYSWYHEVENISTPVYYGLDMVYNPSLGKYVTQFPDCVSCASNAFFFPIDGKGWDDKVLYPNQYIYNDQNGVPRNYHFCMVLHASFMYTGGEIISISGDDDMFFYVNNRLAIDIGGVHSTTSGNTNLDQKRTELNIELGNRYPIDFFICERKTFGSSLNITTDFELLCEYTDFCGVCEGYGHCCKALRDCDDNEECTIDSCPSPNVTLSGNETFKDHCVHKADLACYDKYGVRVETVEPTLETGGNVTLLGRFGNYLTYQTNVTIGNQTCQLISINSTHLICSIGKGSGIHDITVKVNSKSWFGQSRFEYSKISVTIEPPSVTPSQQQQDPPKIENTNNSDKKALSKGVIAGIAAGAGAILLAAIFTTWYIKKRFDNIEHLRVKKLVESIKDQESE
ncbi:PA14 domain-containing protein [Tieghemostelium lacteum]|uniref:PA14 domain-containing protein n=1 Tax=Tieghemostelium lacteum TaxID=361077 RepID=A0A151ZCE4_TIELA|nr:PA14 domain-containing protein [Tieghemostelium lacteum]|eukprot:KYQ91595.1 PA14 domain-containing protein [Tieghemostelium lacteum]